MIQQSDCARFATKARNAIGISRNFVWKKLDRHLTAENLVFSKVDLTHSAGAELLKNPIVGKALGERHWKILYVTIRAPDGSERSPSSGRLDAVRPRLWLPRRVRDDGLGEHRRAYSRGSGHPAGGLLGGAGKIQRRRDRNFCYRWIVGRLRGELLDRLETRTSAGRALRPLRAAFTEEDPGRR